MKLIDKILSILYGYKYVDSLLPPRSIRTLSFTHITVLIYCVAIVYLLIKQLLLSGFTGQSALLLSIILLFAGNFLFFLFHMRVKLYRCSLYLLITLFIMILILFNSAPHYSIMAAAPLPVILISEKSIMRQAVWLVLLPLLLIVLLYTDYMGLDYRLVVASESVVLVLTAYVTTAIFAGVYRFSISRTFWGTMVAYTRSETLDVQMELAETIQRSLIPVDTMRGEHYDVSFFYKPAYGVGGDYFDLLEIGDEQIGIVMCDVAGKGIPAALMMSSVRTIIRGLIADGITDPVQIIKVLNETFRSDFGDEFFVTFAFVLYNSKTQMVEFYNAGHSPFIYYSCVEKRMKEIELDGYPIGIFENAYYGDNISTQLYTGDIVLLFSDGLTDFINSGSYSKARLLLFSEIQKSAHLTADEIKENLIKKFITNKRSNIVNDDISLVIFKVI